MKITDLQNLKDLTLSEASKVTGGLSGEQTLNLIANNTPRIGSDSSDGDNIFVRDIELFSFNDQESGRSGETGIRVGVNKDGGVFTRQFGAILAPTSAGRGSRR